MSLLKDLTLVAIYDFLSHRGEILLKSATPSFEGIVRQSLERAVGGAKDSLPLMQHDQTVDGRLRKGFSHEDAERIERLVGSYVSSFFPESGAIGGGKFIEEVYEGVTDNFPVRAALKNSGVTESLVLEILRSDDKEEKIHAIPLLGEMASEEAKLILHDYLWEQDLDLRIAAVSAVAGMRSESSVPSLLRLLNDGEMQMRLGAVNALARIRSKEAIDALIDVVVCEDSEPVRAGAIDALFDIGASPAAARLTEIAASHADPACCERAREGAAKIRGRSRT